MWSALLVGALVLVPFTSAAWQSRWQHLLEQATACPCTVPWFQHSVQDLQATPLSIRLEMVNRAVNLHIRYRSDLEQYGVLDAWVGPDTTVHAGAGDCEDIVGVKIALLHRLGIPLEQMNGVMLKLPTQEYHIILKVNDFYLDNRTDRVTTHLPTGQPLFQMGSTQMWVFGERHE